MLQEKDIRMFKFPKPSKRIRKILPTDEIPY